MANKGVEINLSKGECAIIIDSAGSVDTVIFPKTKKKDRATDGMMFAMAILSLCKKGDKEFSMLIHNEIESINAKIQGN